MSQEEVEKLNSKIQDLENQLGQREQDIEEYKTQLTQANKQLESLITQVNNELKMIHKMHQLIVPTELPNIPGFEFSTKYLPSLVSGGDYFDIFEHKDKLRFGIMASSASGHGMSALLLSVFLKLTGQMEARRGAEPDKVISRIVDQLQKEKLGAEKADLFYSLVDKRNYTLHYCLLGNVFILHKNSATGDLERVEPTGPALDMEMVDEIEAGTMTLNPNDLLIIATRGLFEEKNQKGEQFGQERLAQLILSFKESGVHELRNYILYNLEKFMGHKEPQRDQTLLVISVKDRVIKLV